MNYLSLKENGQISNVKKYHYNDGNVKVRIRFR